MRFPLCVLALLLGIAVVQAAPVAEPVAAPVVAEPLVEKDGLKVSISAIRPITYNADDKKAYVLDFVDTYRYINVVLQNTSTKPIYVPGEGNSDGWNAITLEISKVNGIPVGPPVIVGRPYVPWRANALSLEAIAPGEALVRQVRFVVPDTQETTGVLGRSLYRKFPRINENGNITMRVVYSSDRKFELPQSQGKRLSAWVGRIASTFQEYTVPSPTY